MIRMGGLRDCFFGVFRVECCLVAGIVKRSWLARRSIFPYLNNNECEQLSVVK